MEGKIVRHPTKDGLYLNGLFKERKGDRAIFYTHGWGGDIVRNRFYDNIYNVAEKIGYAFLIGQNRGSGYNYSFAKEDGTSQMIGSVHEKFEECIIDFEAWLYYLYLKGYKEIVLVGHSFATHKIVYYLTVKKHPAVTKIVLLSPFDIFDLFEYSLKQSKVQLQESIELAKKMTDDGKGLELMPKDKLWFPISAAGFYDHFGPTSKLHIFDFNYDPNFQPEILQKIYTPTLAILGAEDPYVRNRSMLLNRMKEVIPDCTTAKLAGANHSFWKVEKGMENTIINWFKEQK